MLAREVFHSEKIALAATGLHVLFLISSAYPHRQAGWTMLCWAAQDKTVSFAVMTPVVIAFALMFIRRFSDASFGKGRYLVLYAIALIGASLVHPLAIVWCAVAIIPFALIETLRGRGR